MLVVYENLIEPIWHEDFILNMDQNLIPFLFNGHKSIEFVVAQSVHNRTSNMQSMQMCNDFHGIRQSFKPFANV